MAESIGALRVELSANTAQFTDDFKAAAKAVRGASGQMSRDMSGFSTVMSKSQQTVGRLSHELSSFQRIGDLVGGAFGQTAARAAVFADTLSRAAEASKISAAGLIALGAAASAGAVVGLLALGHEISETTDEIGKSAKTIGISAEALQELRYAADLSRVSTDELNTSLQRFAKSIGDAVINPTGQVAQLFKSLGINLVDAQGHVKSFESILATFADKIKDLGSAQQKASVLSLLMGRSALNMGTLFADGAKGVAIMREEAHKYGYVISNEAVAAGEDLNDDLGRLGATLEGMKTAFEVGLIAPIDDLAKSLADGNVGLAKFAEMLGQDVGGAVVSVLEGIRDLNDGIEKLGGVWNQLPEGIKSLFANPTASAPAGSTFGFAPNGGGLYGYLQKFGLAGSGTAAPVATAPPAPLAPKIPAQLAATGTLNPIVNPQAAAQLNRFAQALAQIKQQTAAAGLDKDLDAVTIEATKLAVQLKPTTAQLQQLVEALGAKQSAEQAARFRDAMKGIATQIRDVGLDKYTKMVVDFGDQLHPTTDQVATFKEQVQDLKDVDFAQTLKDIADQTRDLGLSDVDAQVADLTDTMGLSVEQAAKLQDALAKLQAAKGDPDLLTNSLPKDFAQSGVQQLASAFVDVATGAEAAQTAIEDVITALSKLILQQTVEAGIVTGLEALGVPPSLFAGLPHFATGGSFPVGGVGGTDSQLVAFRASPNEHVTVETPGQRSGRRAGGDVYNIDARGADRQGLANLQAQIVALHGSIEHRAVAAVSAKGRRSVGFRKAIGG